MSGVKTCVAVDVGGTSRDIAFIEGGVPEISESGAVVGNWKTMIRAVKILTSAMGRRQPRLVTGKNLHRA